MDLRGAAQRHGWARDTKLSPLDFLGPDTSLPMARSGEPFLVMLAHTPPPRAVAAMLDATDRGARVYVLAEPGFGEGSAEPGLGQRLRGRALIRRVRDLPCSALLTARGGHAGLFLAPEAAAEPTWWLPLSAGQGQALFQIFLHLFWHCAEDEAWTGAGSLEFRPPGQRPFDTPLPDHDAALRLLDSSAMLPDAQDIWHAPDRSLPPGCSQLIVVPPHGSGQDELCNAARAGASVAWECTNLPLLTTDGHTGTIDLCSQQWRLRLALEPLQAGALTRLIRGAAAEAPWNFRVAPAVGKLAGRVWLADAATPASPIDCHEIPCGQLTADSLRVMASTSPRQWPAANPLARKVIWTWTVDPPRVPAGAKDDPLVFAWRALDQDVKTRLTRVCEHLEQVASHESTLQWAFAALAGALLGFGRTRASLLHEADDIDATPPSSLGPAGARTLLRRLSELEESAGKLGLDVAEAERKAREDREREEQHAEWQRMRYQAEADLPAIRDELKLLQQQLEEVEAGFATLSEIANKADRKARKGRLRNDKARLEQHIKSLQVQEARLQKTVDASFEYRPSRPSPSAGAPRGARSSFIPAVRATRDDLEVPEEALPGTGSLLVAKGVRYLVIDSWDALDKAEREAARLNATLVAPASGPA